MQIANISEVQAQLSQLLNQAIAGDEVAIARANELLVRLEPLARDTRPRVGGQWAGQVQIPDNFEFTDDEIDAMGCGSAIPEAE